MLKSVWNLEIIILILQISKREKLLDFWKKKRETKIKIPQDWECFYCQTVATTLVKPTQKGINKWPVKAWKYWSEELWTPSVPWFLQWDFASNSFAFFFSCLVFVGIKLNFSLCKYQCSRHESSLEWSF